MPQLLRRYHTAWNALDRALRLDHALGASEFEVLDALSETEARRGHNGALRMRDLGACVQLSQSALPASSAAWKRTAWCCA
jgi:hypothetical protein